MALRWAFIGSLFILSLGVLIQPLGDPDVYLHLRDGRYFSEHGWKPALDPFSYTAADRPLDRVEMVFRAGLYAAWRAGGYNLLIACKAGLMTAAFFLLGLVLYRRWPNAGAAGLLLLAAILVPLGLMPPLTRFFHERPYIFTYLFLPVVMLLLEDFRSAGTPFPQAAKRLWALPALVAVWVNLHPGFVMALAFLAAHIIDYAWTAWQQPSVWHRRRLATAAGVLAASLLAGAVNPMGFSIYGYILWHLLPNAFMATITEYAPPTWQQAPFFFLLLGLVWLAVLLARRAVRLSDFILLAGVSYMAWKSYRNIPLFWFTALPPLAGCLRDGRERWLAGRSLPAVFKTSIPALGAVLVLGWTGWLASQGLAWRWGEFTEYHPAAGLAWLEQQGWQGRLFALDRWGGYIGWKTGGRLKIFLDGRLKLFGEKLYADYCQIVYGRPAAQQVLDRCQIEGVLASPQSDIRLFQRLWQSQAWDLVYWDDVCLLYVRRGGADQGLADKFAYRLVDPNRSPPYDPADLPASLRELERAVQTAPKAYSPLYLKGDLLLCGRDPAGAREMFERVLALSPRHLGSHFQLGLIALGENRWQEAEPYLRFVIRASPDPALRGQAEYYLALALRQIPGRLAEAAHWAKKAQTLLPGWQPVESLIKELEAKR